VTVAMPRLPVVVESKGLSDYPRHLAAQIIEGLDLKAEATDHVKNQIRYATAWFDWELTKLAGA
jgi:hypothetical protein